MLGLVGIVYYLKFAKEAGFLGDVTAGIFATVVVVSVAGIAITHVLEQIRDETRKLASAHAALPMVLNQALAKLQNPVPPARVGSDAR